MSEPPDPQATAPPPEDDPTSSQVSGGVTIHGSVIATRDAHIAASQVFNNSYTLEQHQTRLEDYQRLLHRLATSERAQLLLVAEPPLTNGLPLDKLRLIMARAALDWPLPLPEPSAPLDDSLQRSMVAALLLPLLTTTTLVLTLHANWALGQLASNSVAVLVQRLGLDYLKSRMQLDQSALNQAHMRLTRALDDPSYKEGCARLLHDMAMTEAGQTALAVAWHERQRNRGTGQAVPLLLQLFAAGVAGGIGSGMTMALLQLLRTTPVPPPPAQPSPVPTPRAVPPPSPELSIPVRVSEWQAELDRRNERFGAPEGYWCYVRPGRYRIGGWAAGQPSADVTLPAFWIARVPITVAQFMAFTKSGGSGVRELWTDHKHHNVRPRQAVVGVTWREVNTFGTWLSAQLRLPPGYTVRLPSDAEWEAAAAFDAAWHRRTYPWGETSPTTHHAVFDRSLNDGAPDVATRPAGAAACGALDMAGTVWEWASSTYEGYPDRAATLLAEAEMATNDSSVRGGSWRTNSTYVRCGARGWNRPDHWDHRPGVFGWWSPPLARTDVLNA